MCTMVCFCKWRALQALSEMHVCLPLASDDFLYPQYSKRTYQITRVFGNTTFEKDWCL